MFLSVIKVAFYQATGSLKTMMIHKVPAFIFFKTYQVEKGQFVSFWCDHLYSIQKSITGYKNSVLKVIGHRS